MSVAPTGDASLGSLVSGEEAYVDGTHVWTDYVYDDRGPNSDVLPGGDSPYPGAPHPLGTADLVQVQLGTAPGGSPAGQGAAAHRRQRRHALVGIGFDEDQRSSTGAPTLPGAAWSNTEPLGLEHLVALGTDGRGALWTWRGGRWTAGPTLTVEVDRQSNTVGLDVAGLRPGASQWNVVGVAGRLAGGGSWLDGGLPIQDLAYLRAEDPTDIGALSVPQQLPQDNYQPYQDWDQADVLAGRLPVERAIGTVTFGTRRDVEPPVRTGFNAFLYHSTAPVPEGEQGPVRLFSSAFQPYGVWIPRTLPTRRPLVVFLHGSNQYQNVNVVYFNNPFDPAGIQPFHDLQAVTIFPNGRTPQWGAPLADRDALDAMNDALGRRQLRLDRDRIVVTGISSGGYGSFHLASRYPDLFTGAYSIVGGAVGGDGPDATPLENLTNVPFRASNGLADPLVALPDLALQCRRAACRRHGGLPDRADPHRVAQRRGRRGRVLPGGPGLARPGPQPGPGPVPGADRRPRARQPRPRPARRLLGRPPRAPEPTAQRIDRRRLPRPASPRAASEHRREREQRGARFRLLRSEPDLGPRAVVADRRPPSSRLGCSARRAAATGSR